MNSVGLGWGSGIYETKSGDSDTDDHWTTVLETLIEIYIILWLYYIQ